MASTDCGFSDRPGALGCDLLIGIGPTLIVNIGLDPNYDPAISELPPTLPTTAVRALVDTGATDSCIDKRLAKRVGLAIVDRQQVSGVHGAQEVDMYLAHIHVPALDVTHLGMFAGVDLKAGGILQQAIIGRTFLRHFTLTYDGTTGRVALSRP